MNIFPSSALVSKVQGLILETFEVSPEQAHSIAAELVSLAEAWGSPEVAEKLDWSYRVKKDLGESGKLRWRSEEERERFLTAERQKYAAWDRFIRTKNRG
jgi:hypothetical protein